MVEITRLQEIFTEKVLQQVRKNNCFQFYLTGASTQNLGHFF